MRSRPLPWIGQAWSESRPWVGQSFWLDIHSEPSNVGMAGLVPGASLTPPQPLDRIGMPSCAAFVAFDVVESVASFGGSGIWSATVPPDPSLVRGCFYAQAFTVYPVSPTPAGALVSNVAVTTIGSR